MLDTRGTKSFIQKDIGQECHKHIPVLYVASKQDLIKLLLIKNLKLRVIKIRSMVKVWKMVKFSLNNPQYEWNTEG